MSNTSSLRLTPSKRQQERQNSIGLARNEKVKYKVEKVKPLHKTPSGREPKQKKKLKKEELQSYDIEDVVDDISNTNSEDDNVNGEEIGSLTEESLQLKENDQSQTNVSNSVNPCESNSQSSSMDVNLSRTEDSGQTSSIQMQDEEMSRLPQFYLSSKQSPDLQDTNESKSSVQDTNESKSPVQDTNESKSSGRESHDKPWRVKNSKSKDKTMKSVLTSGGKKTSVARLRTGKIPDIDKSSAQLDVTIEDSPAGKSTFLKSTANQEKEIVCVKCGVTLNDLNGEVSNARMNNRNSKGRKRRLKSRTVRPNTSIINGKSFHNEFYGHKCAKCGRKRIIFVEKSDTVQNSDTIQDAGTLKDELKLIVKFKQAVREIISENKSAKIAQSMGETTNTEKETEVIPENKLRQSKSYASVTKLNIPEKVSTDEGVHSNIVKRTDINEDQSSAQTISVPELEQLLSNEQSQNSEASSMGIKHLYPNSNDQSQQNTEASSMGIKHLYQNSNDQSQQNSDASSMDINHLYQNSNDQPQQNSEASSMGIKHLYQNSNDQSHFLESSKGLEQSNTSASENDRRDSDVNIKLDKMKIIGVESKSADVNFADKSSTRLDEIQHNHFKQDLRGKIKDLVGREFPQKIETITQLLAQEKQKHTAIIQSTNLLSNTFGSFSSFPYISSVSSQSHLHTAANTERKLLTVDADLVDLNSKVNSYIQTFVQDIGSLKPWLYEVVYTEPSVAVNHVNQVSQEIATAEKETVSMQEKILAYYVQRNNVISEIFKYLHLQNENSEHLLEAINYSHYIDLQIMLSKLRNKYNILHNLVMTLLKQSVIQE